jgi:hypothetical protein
MAKHAHNTGAPRRAPLIPTPPAAIMAAMLNRHSEREIADAMEIMVDLLDMMHGDTDLEPNGDELDGDSRSEDSFEFHGGYGPGCPIADEDYERDDYEPDGAL